jgi:hypothetical protein
MSKRDWKLVAGTLTVVGIVLAGFGAIFGPEEVTFGASKQWLGGLAQKISWWALLVVPLIYIVLDWDNLFPKKKADEEQEKLIGNSEGNNTRKDKWDKALAFFEILKVLSIIIAGSIINTTLKTNELEIQYVKIAVDVLQAKPDPTTKELRAWAVKVLDKKSDIPLGEEAVKTLLEKELPSAKVYLDDMSEKEFNNLSLKEFDALKLKAK